LLSLNSDGAFRTTMHSLIPQSSSAYSPVINAHIDIELQMYVISYEVMYNSYINNTHIKTKLCICI